MNSWELVVLGSGSARPTARRNPSAHALHIGRKIYLIDCGEGTQMQLCKAHLSFEHIVAIFITHLHADHTLGLFGLLASMNMTGRTLPLDLFAHSALQPLLNQFVSLFVTHLNFDINFHPLPREGGVCIFSDRQVCVSTIPLKHRIPTSGFKFQEPERVPNIKPEIVTQFQLNKVQINTLKNGSSIRLKGGELLTPESVLYQRFTPRSFAYMSDTLYNIAALPYVEGVDFLYHEATYTQALQALAYKTYHSTAQQAAQFAKLAGVKHLLIGHYSARYPNPNLLLTEAQEIFPQTLLAKELDIHHI